MKKALRLIFLVAVLAPAMSQSPAAALLSCGGYDGTACTTPGEKFRCQWIPGEPGRCVCSSSFVWNCG